MEISEENYQKAIAVVWDTSSGSVSNLQRRLHWGYCRAAAAIDRMQKEFIVSPMSASGRRDVYPSDIHQLWKELQAAKAQAVPEAKAVIDVIAERKRQIEKEHYAIEHDDEYQNNELLRASVSYSNHALARGWIHDSQTYPDAYQIEEAPDEWPFDFDFWKPKSPRQDLVRAAALIIAEIERIDRIEAQEQGHD